MTPSAEPKFLAIETATDVCSIAIFEGEELLGLQEYRTGRLHNRLLSVATEQLLANLELKVSDLSAIGVSAGPGSYTGLRVGAAYAKGLCFASDLPLVAVPSLEVISGGALFLLSDKNAQIVSLLDARRMEVYVAVYDSDLQETMPATALIIDFDTLNQITDKEFPVVCVGDGAEKCRELWAEHDFARLYTHVLSSAAHMGKSIGRRFEQQEFVSVDAFAPLYLKPVVTRKGRNPLENMRTKA